MKQFFIFFEILFLSVILMAFKADCLSGKLIFKGQLFDLRQQPIPEGLVQLKSLNGETISTHNINEVGKFIIKLEYQEDYTIHFIAVDYKSMYMQIDSRVPLSKSKRNRFIKIPINMIGVNDTNFNVSAFQSKPFVRLFYNTEMKEFDFDFSSIVN